MKDLRRNILVILAVISFLFLLIFCYLMYDVLMFSGRWIGSSYNPRLKDLRSDVFPGSIYDINGVELAGSTYGKRTYPENEELRIGTSHIIGDLYGFSPMGVETTQGAWLLGYNEKLLDRIERLISNETAHGSDITLTVDSDLCVYIADKLSGYSGAAVVLNYKTGEILAMVSFPSFDASTIDVNLANGGAQEDSLVNRVIQGQYSPGSMFDIITASAAMEYLDLSNREFYCTGTSKIGDDNVTCRRRHGSQTFEEAIINNCNCAIAEMGIEIGARNIQKIAENAGFNYQFMFTDIILYESTIDLGAMTSDIDLASAAGGGYSIVISPMHLAMIYGSIANDGKMNTLKLIHDIEGQNIETGNNNTKKFFDYATANKLDEILKIYYETKMQNNITNNDGEIYGMSAEIVNNDEQSQTLSWFAGYIKDDNCPYVLVIVEENYDKKISDLENAAFDILQNVLNTYGVE